MLFRLGEKQVEVDTDLIDDGENGFTCKVFSWGGIKRPDQASSSWDDADRQAQEWLESHPDIMDWHFGPNYDSGDVTDYYLSRS